MCIENNELVNIIFMKKLCPQFYPITFIGVSFSHLGII